MEDRLKTNEGNFNGSNIVLEKKHLQNLLMINHEIIQERTEHDEEDGKSGEAVPVNAAGYFQLQDNV